MGNYNYTLEVGDVVLVKEGGWWGLPDKYEGKYVEVISKTFNSNLNRTMFGVKSYDQDVGNEYYNSVWIEAFGENPTILLNVNEERVVDEDHVDVAVGSKDEADTEYTGGSSSYYKVYVKHPTTLGEPYEAECNDIIEALNMTFAEGNAFKAIWRKAKARQGVKKKGYDNGVYDSEKVVFFGKRMLVEAKNES